MIRINGLKSQIDSLTTMLRSSASEQGSAEKDSILSELDNVKKDYKAAYAELQSCKNNISVCENDKKMSLAAVLAAFDNLQQQSALVS